MLVRFIAIALIGFDIIELVLSWVENAAQHVSMRAIDFLLPAVLFVSGIGVLLKAAFLAEWISDKLDE